MGFAENMGKLVVSNGNQLKIKDKDKAIMEIADEIINGGGAKLAEIKSFWYYSSNGTYTKLSSVTPEGYKPQVFNFDFANHFDKAILSKSDSDEFSNDDVIAEFSYLIGSSSGTIVERDLNFEIKKNFKFKNLYYKAFTRTDDSTHTPNTPDGFCNIWVDSDINNAPDITLQINTNQISD